MPTLVAHKTALHRWTSTTKKAPPALEERERAYKKALAWLAEKEKPSVDDLIGEGEYYVKPITAMAHKSARTRTKTFTTYHRKNVIEGSFIEIHPTLLLASPEYTFLQMASVLSLEQLILLGYELCGTYASRYDAIRGSRNFTLSTPQNLACFLENASGETGVLKAKRALQYIRPNSASIMESILVMLLSLPPNLGGYGLPWPELNREIQPREKERVALNQKLYRGDLVFNASSLIVEYDSNLAHSGEEHINHDAKRRNDLSTLGFSMITITRNQIFSEEDFDKSARQIARNLDHRLRLDLAKFQPAHRRLRCALFPALNGYEESQDQ